MADRDEYAVRIRPATVRDFEKVGALLGELGRPAVTPETRGVYRGAYERHLARPENASLVAELDGAVVGFVAVDLRERLNYTTFEAWIPDLIVTEKARGHGIGQRLLQAAFKFAADKKAHLVVVETGSEIDRSHDVFLIVGMTHTGAFYTLDPRKAL